MAIQKGDYITLSYTGFVEGVPFDTTDAEEAKKGNMFKETATYAPIVVKVGGGHLVPGLDADLAGKEIGQEYTVTIEPKDGFGPHKDEDVKAIDKKGFEEKPELYERVTVDGRSGIVVNKIGSRYLVDFNHPLAGKELVYTYKIESLVEDPIEKLTGLIHLFTGETLKISKAHDSFLSIEVPPFLSLYAQNWMMTRYMINHEAFELFPEIESVKYVETVSRPSPKPEGVSEEDLAELEELKAQGTE